MAVDIRRTCSIDRVKPWVDSDETVLIRWYRVPEGTKALPHWHKYSHPDWDPGRPKDEPLSDEIGVYPGGRYNKGAVPDYIGTNGTPCGPPSAWIGARADTNPPLVYDGITRVARCCGVPLANRDPLELLPTTLPPGLLELLCEALPDPVPVPPLFTGTYLELLGTPVVTSEGLELLGTPVITGTYLELLGTPIVSSEDMELLGTVADILGDLELLGTPIVSSEDLELLGTPVVTSEDLELLGSAADVLTDLELLGSAADVLTDLELLGTPVVSSEDLELLGTPVVSSEDLELLGTPVVSSEDLELLGTVADILGDLELLGSAADVLTDLELLGSAADVLTDLELLGTAITGSEDLELLGTAITGSEDLELLGTVADILGDLELVGMPIPPETIATDCCGNEVPWALYLDITSCECLGSPTGIACIFREEFLPGKVWMTDPIQCGGEELIFSLACMSGTWVAAITIAPGTLSDSSALSGTCSPFEQIGTLQPIGTHCNSLGVGVRFYE